MILVSVIIPVYNSEKWISKCLDSLLEHNDLSKFEIILVNDGSIDNSKKIIESYTTKYSNIKLYSLENGGVSKARNFGLDKASGEYITFIDSDDWVENNYIDDAIDKIKANNVDIMCFGSFIDYSNKQVIKSPKLDKVVGMKEYFKILLTKNLLDQTVTNKFFNKKLLNSIYFDCQIKIGEDYLFLSEALLKTNRIGICHKCYYHYYMNDSSAMRKKFNVSRFDSIKVSNKVEKMIAKAEPELLPYLKSANIDYYCRVVCDIIYSNMKKQYITQYKDYMKIIRNYGILKKYKYSSKKHFIAYLLTRISPKLYNFVKNDLKMQYK